MRRDRRRRPGWALPCAFALLLCPGEPRPQAQTSAAPLQAGAAPAASLPEAPSTLQAAEATASITGLVTDTTGGVVPGATVAVLDAAGKVARETHADAEGSFVLPHLPPGACHLRISATGLETFEPPTIELKSGEVYKLQDTALPIATANESVNVVLTTTQIADEELREEEKQRVLGILPNFYTSYVWDAAPLNTRQKFHLGLRSVTDPYVFARTGIIAGIQQARGTYPEYGTGGSGYAERYAAAYGDAITGRLIGSAVLPAIFHQDPRYFYRGTGGIPRRALHALFSSVMARSDRGNIVPNYTRSLGDFTAGYISRTWHPGADNGITLALDNMLYGIADAAGANLLREFIYKHISTGTSPYSKGKPPQERENPLHP